MGWIRCGNDVLCVCVCVIAVIDANAHLHAAHSPTAQWWTCLRFSFQFSNNFVVFDVFVARNRMTIYHTKHIHHIGHIVTSAAKHSIDSIELSRQNDCVSVSVSVCVSCLEPAICDVQKTHFHRQNCIFVHFAASVPLTPSLHLPFSRSLPVSVAGKIDSIAYVLCTQHTSRESTWTQMWTSRSRMCRSLTTDEHEREIQREYAGIIAEHRYHLIHALSLYFVPLNVGLNGGKGGGAFDRLSCTPCEWILHIFYAGRLPDTSNSIAI